MAPTLMLDGEECLSTRFVAVVESEGSAVCKMCTDAEGIAAPLDVAHSPVCRRFVTVERDAPARHGEGDPCGQQLSSAVTGAI